MWSQVKEGLLDNFNNNPNIKEKVFKLEKSVKSGKMMPTTAAKKLRKEWEIEN